MVKIVLASVLLFISIAASADDVSALQHKAELGDLTVLKQAFALRAKTDGGDAEDWDIAIGKSITRKPQNFLTALKQNRTTIPKLGPIVGNLGPEFVDDFKKQRAELKKRLHAIHSVKDKSLNSVRTDCETVLKSQIAQRSEN